MSKESRMVFNELDLPCAFGSRQEECSCTNCLLVQGMTDAEELEEATR